MLRKHTGQVTTRVLVTCLGATMLFTALAHAGQGKESGSYQVLSPITHGNLTIFPVVTAGAHGNNNFLSLDEGLRSGEVVVTEAGRVQPLVRGNQRYVSRGDGAEVNRLVLVNNSDRPLLLLAGEIVTGGKQDRVVGKDRIIPAKSDPVDMAVFCVEPGRWVERSGKFGALSSQMAQPSVRAKAMSDKDQSMVWDQVHESATKMAKAAPEAAAAIGGTSSYATVMSNKEVEKRIETVSVPILRSYDSLVRDLKDRNAVGVVVAVNGRIIWADMFSSSNLLQKYWPKLVRSYAAEAVATSGTDYRSDVKLAEAFLHDMDGRRALVETEPGVFRHTEITGRDFKVFELTSLLSKESFDVHVTKMAE